LEARPLAEFILSEAEGRKMTKAQEQTVTTWMGIDIGGTFTDLVALNETTGAITFSKVPLRLKRRVFSESRMIADG